jgi:PhzF family phenazine biosynthesis protein
MRTFYATAFADKIGIENKPISGNPAGIVICENGLPAKEMMAKMAMEVQQPIVAFLNQREGNQFDMQFYFPDGEPCFLCGHGTLVSAYFIHQVYGFEEVIFKINGHELQIKCRVNGRQMVKAYLAAYTLVPMPAEKLPVYLELLNLQPEDIVRSFYSMDLTDCVLVLKNCNKMRALNPDYIRLSAQIRTDHFRAIMVTAASENELVDYEIRIFCPYVAEDEDISCGSANCYLLPYWKKTLHEENRTEDMVILCPFKPASKSFGGIEHGNYYAEKEQVSIAGYIHEL